MIAIRLAEAAGEHRSRAAGARHLRRAVSDQAPAAARARARSGRCAGAADRRARSRRRGVRGLSAGSAQRLPDHHSGIRHRASAAQPPIVVLTSNRTREIHDALKRRCLYHWVDYPTAERELAIVRSRRSRAFPQKLSEQVVAFVQVLRDQDLFKVAGRRRNHRLGHGADPARRAHADAAGGRRLARRAAQVSGRHRPHAGRTLQKTIKRGIALSEPQVVTCGSCDRPRAEQPAESATHRKRTDRRQHCRLRPLVAGRRRSGGPGRGDRRDAGAAADRHRHARRRFRHPAVDLRHAARAHAGVRRRRSICSSASTALESMLGSMLPQAHGAQAAAAAAGATGAGSAVLGQRQDAGGDRRRRARRAAVRCPTRKSCRRRTSRR